MREVEIEADWPPYEGAKQKGRSSSMTATIDRDLGEGLLHWKRPSACRITIAESSAFEGSNKVKHQLEGGGPLGVSWVA